MYLRQEVISFNLQDMQIMEVISFNLQDMQIICINRESIVVWSIRKTIKAARYLRFMKKAQKSTVQIYLNLSHWAENTFLNTSAL